MSRTRWLTIARVTFLGAAIFFGWWSLRGQWPEVLAVIAQVGVLSWVLATGLVLAGVTATGFVWGRIVRAYGHVIPRRQALSIFFVGQLGKYIPGSVWSLGAQAQMARAFDVPARTTVAAGLVFLVWNVASAGLVAALLGSLVWTEGWLTTSVTVSAAVVGLASMSPPVSNWVGSRLAGEPARLRLTWRDSGTLALLMAGVWTAYGVALVVLGSELSDPSAPLGFALAAGAFSAAYVVGVVVVLAPAGLGAREATLTLLLAPGLGLAGAAAVALSSRVIHTVADFVVALLAWVRGRMEAPTRSSTPSAGGGDVEA